MAAERGKVVKKVGNKDEAAKGKRKAADGKEDAPKRPFKKQKGAHTQKGAGKPLKKGK